MPGWVRGVIRTVVDGGFVVAVIGGIFAAGRFSNQFEQLQAVQAADKAEHEAARKSALATQLRLQRLELKSNITTPVEVDSAAAEAPAEGP